MISHDRAQELISARMDAPLNPAEHRELQGHLATCQACRVFVTQADELARGMQVMPRLAASPAVSRGVMTAIAAENSGWNWLQRGLQALSSPGLAVASAAVLVVALTGALLIAVNAPDGGMGTEPEVTVAALAESDINEVPTSAPTETPAPTATSAPPRVIEDAAEPTERPARTPTPRPTATSAPMIAAVDTQPAAAPASEAVGGESPPIEPVADDSSLGMAAEQAVDPASADLAQDAVIEAPVESVEDVAPVASGEGDSGQVETAAVEDDSGRQDDRKDGDKDKDQAPEAAPEVETPVPTHEIGPVFIPREAIDAMEAAGTAPEDYLPPPPVDPMMPPQDFLPVTPTPEGDGTPTPEAPTQSDAPQLAEEWQDELGVTALAPEPPAETTIVEEPAPVIVADDEKVKERGKRDKESREGNSHEAEQSAHDAAPMGWMAEGSELALMLAEPVTLAQTAETPVPAETTGTTDPATTAPAAATDPAATTATDQPRQIDPATGLEIDPVSGLLIDPTTGYLIDVANGRLIDPRTGYLVDPMTGLLEDPATGALLDPNTLAVVIPAGFGDDTPDYNPGDPNMRGAIEGVVDDNYDNATYKVIPPTDGPVQPVDEIVVPTESGDALEIQ